MPRPSLNGVRAHYIVSKYQYQTLREISDRTGMTVAEHVRRAVDLYLEHMMERLKEKGPSPK